MNEIAKLRTYDRPHLVRLGDGVWLTAELRDAPDTGEPIFARVHAINDGVYTGTVENFPRLTFAHGLQHGGEIQFAREHVAHLARDLREG